MERKPEEVRLELPPPNAATAAAEQRPNNGEFEEHIARLSQLFGDGTTLQMYNPWTCRDIAGLIKAVEARDVSTFLVEAEARAVRAQAMHLSVQYHTARRDQAKAAERATIVAANISSATRVKDLRQMCRDIYINSSGSKAELLSRLQRY